MNEKMITKEFRKKQKKLIVHQNLLIHVCRERYAVLGLHAQAPNSHGSSTVTSGGARDIMYTPTPIQVSKGAWTFDGEAFPSVFERLGMPLLRWLSLHLSFIGGL